LREVTDEVTPTSQRPAADLAQQATGRILLHDPVRQVGLASADPQQFHVETGEVRLRGIYDGLEQLPDLVVGLERYPPARQRSESKGVFGPPGGPGVLR
jgi:hypothetical protein